MSGKKKMLIAITLMVIMLLNVFMPILNVGAATTVKVTFESNLYNAVKDELVEQNINAAYIDEQRTIIISDEEIAKVTELSLANAGITDLTGLETFKNVTKLDLSANKLNKESNLEVLNSFNLTTLDLSSNAIEDVSMISGLDSIQNLYLHNQKFDVIEIIELDTTTESDQITEVSVALPEIITRSGYLNTEWLVEEKSGSAKINWSKFDHKNIKLQVASKTDSTYVPYKEMVTLKINVSDETNALYNSDINIFFVIIDSEERGIHIPDKNMYNAVKQQLTKYQTINSDLISYTNTQPSNLRRNLYERYYDKPQVLVISINDIINKIPSLKLSNKKIEKLDGIEKFVGLETELDLSGNYIKSIDKLIELQENQIIEEQKLQERVRKQLSEVSDTVGKINTINKNIESEQKAIDELNNKKIELEEKLEKLEIELADLRNKKEELEFDKTSMEQEIAILKEGINDLKELVEENKKVIKKLNEDLDAIKANKQNLEKELVDLKNQLANLETALETPKEELKKQIANKEAQIVAKNNEITQKQADIENKQKEIDNCIESMKEKQEEIDSKTLTISQYDIQISEINILISQKDLEAAEITEELKKNAIVSFDEIIFSDEEKWEMINTYASDQYVISNSNQIYNVISTVTDGLSDEATIILNKTLDTAISTSELESEFDKLSSLLQGAYETALQQERLYSGVNQNVRYILQQIRSNLESKVQNANYVPTLKRDALQIHSDLSYATSGLSQKVLELMAEKARLQAEIDKLRVEINNNGNGGLEGEKAELEANKLLLENQKARLVNEKSNLQTQLLTLAQELADLQTRLDNLEKQGSVADIKANIEQVKKDIKAKEAQIVNVQEQVAAKEKEIAEQQSIITEYEKQIEAKQKEITDKEAKLKEKVTALEAKEKEITAKVAEIAKIVEEINKQNNSIAEKEIAIAKLIKDKEVLDEVLVSQMTRLYEIYNRVDKLTSIITPDLKNITSEEFKNLTFEKAKTLFAAQISKISQVEENLTDFEKAYLIGEYNIPTVIEVEVEKVVQKEDGTTETIKETKIEKIEKPISKYFGDLSKNTQDWKLNDYKGYLKGFRQDDVYLSMTAYCYLTRFFNNSTACVANEYADIEIKKLSFDNESTEHLINGKNNYKTITQRYDYSCSGTASASQLLVYAARMANSSGDVNVYVVLPRLKSLNVEENLIENIDEISKLSELRMFYAYDNEIVNINNVNWSAMTKLRILDLGFNGISDILPLESLVNLEELYLKGNLIAGSFEFDISKLEKLKELDLSENQIDDIQKLINYLTFEARAKGYADVAAFLRSSSTLNIKLKGQALSMNVDRKFDINENRKIDLPKIFRQIEEIDYANTSFGIDSLNGNVTNDGKQVILDTTREGNYSALVTIINTKTTTSLGSGTSCRINYTVGNVEPVAVTITPAEVEVILGKTAQFTAEVTGENVPYKGVIWEVQGATSAETTISESGLLTVAADETAENLVVKATSIYDETKFAEAKVVVVKKEVSTITLTPETTTIFKGESAEFVANVDGMNLEQADKAVDWNLLVREIVNENGEEVLENFAEGTKVSFDDNKLMITISENETMESFGVKATSRFDNTKVAISMVTIAERTVSEVTITPANAEVEKGKTQEFTANVNGENLRTEDKAVTYTVEGNNSAKTTITKEGLLTIGDDETATTVTVKATSNYDNTKYAVATVKVASKVFDSTLGYTVSEEYVLGVATKTPISEFKSKLADGYKVVVKNDGKEVTSGNMKTGMYIEVQDENGNALKDENGHLVVYQVVVKGDINGDGIADALDSNLIKAHRNEVVELAPVQQEAADIDDNNKIDLLDTKLLLYHRAEVKGYSLDYVK